MTDLSKSVLSHGGDIYTPRLEDNIEMLDFSSNISPMGLPRGIQEAVTENLQVFEVYPDPLCRELRAALADYHSVDIERIVCGNGAADLIYRIVQWSKPQKALIVAPGFSEYQKALFEEDVIIETYELTYPYFTVGEDILDYITPEIDIIFLCNPNNPTGVTVDQELIKTLLKKCVSCDTLAVIDECFNEFLDDPSSYSVIDQLESIPKLIILKAFTKIYAMAGFRLGYILCGSKEVAANITDTGQPWSVSSIAQIAGIQALAETDYVARLRQMIRTERERLKLELSALGLEILSGSANYIFFRLGSISDKFTEPEAFAIKMSEQGILVRSCSNYSGLDQSYYRVAVRLPEENDLLIQAVQKLYIPEAFQKEF